MVPKNPAALQDAQRAVGLVRLRAKEWGVDPHKVGVLGFSAGGFLAADISNHFETRTYSAVDAADKESCRPTSVPEPESSAIRQFPIRATQRP